MGNFLILTNCQLSAKEARWSLILEHVRSFKKMDLEGNPANLVLKVINFDDGCPANSWQLF